MSARILVVDDVETNVRLLEAKLTIEYYDVATCRDGTTAIEIARAEQPDLILLDVMMPVMDGFETCRRRKNDPATRHIPVVLVTALDGRDARIRGLEAGADDFLSKPLDDVILMARVRSLTRLKIMIDELREREESVRRMGIGDAGIERLRGTGGRIVIVDDHDEQAAHIVTELGKNHRPVHLGTMSNDLSSSINGVDLLIINAATKGFDGLRLLAHLRARESTRNLPILTLVDTGDRPRLLKALELGTNDIVSIPVDGHELSARAFTQVRRKRYTEFLRERLERNLEAAVTDALTGLHNRRYMSSQLQSLVSRANLGGDQVAVLILDLDHFKIINDSFGHDAGDEVLREFAVRLATNVRAVDLPCRLGGEEFVVVMPDTSLEDARTIAERIRSNVSHEPFRAKGMGEGLTVTVSIGVAASLPDDTPETLLKRADQGVYEAKSLGRDQVIVRAA